MNKLAVVTGGTRGIGAAIARRLKEAGYTVVSNYLDNDERAAKFCDETGIETRKWNVADSHACAEQLAAIMAEHGTVSVLVNNAGITRDGLMHRTTIENWDEVITTNLSSLFYMTHPVISPMRDQRWGRIVSISSINGVKGQFGQTNYSAAKAGVLGFTKALAQETARKGITVNAIAPGYVDTDMVAVVPQDVLESKIISQIPIGRLGTADEIAHTVMYLVDEKAAWITGATININGGQHMG